MPPSSSSSSSSQSFDNVVYYALNDYGVTLVDILVNGSMFALGLVIVILNSIVLDTMIRRQAHVEVLNILIGSLATADLLNGVSLIANVVYNMVYYQCHIECLIRLGFIHCLIVASVFHLTVLTFDRYVKIMKPLVYREIFTPTNATIACLVIWCFGLLFAVLPAMGWSLEEPTRIQTNGTDESDCEVPVCSYFGLLDPNYIRLLVALALIPFIIMVTLYCVIFRVAHRHAKQIAAQEVAGGPDHNHNNKTSSHTWKYTKTVIILMGLFLLSWSPSGAVLILVTSGQLDDMCVVQRGTVLTYTSLLAFLNSVVNPVVYAVKLPPVRMRFKAIFCCRDRNKSRSNSAAIVAAAHSRKQSLGFKEGQSVLNHRVDVSDHVYMSQNSRHIQGVSLQRLD